MMDRQGRGLAETVWTRLDRKAGAITELTIRQLSTSPLNLGSLGSRFPVAYCLACLVYWRN